MSQLPTSPFPKRGTSGPGKEYTNGTAKFKIARPLSKSV